MRQVEGVAVPLEDRKLLLHMGQPRTRYGPAHLLKQLPTALGVKHTADFGAHCLGQQLTSQAVVDRWNTAPNKILQRRYFSRPLGQGVVDAHGTIHARHGLGAIQVDAIQLARIDPQRMKIQARFIQHLGQMARWAIIDAGKRQAIAHQQPPPPSLQQGGCSDREGNSGR
jgi:hypothetical protein